MNKLNQLVEKCKPRVIEVFVNSHRLHYETVLDSLNSSYTNEEEMKEDIGEEILSKMMELNTIVEIYFYPHTIIGHIKIFHYDLETALDIALNYFDE